LLTQAVPAYADLKITTRTGNCTSTSTRYTQGSNFRIDIHDANGPQQILIYNADHQQFYTLDAATHAHTVKRVEQPKRIESLQRASDIQSERRVSEPGSCSGSGEKRIKTDGWYIDLPAAPPRTAQSPLPNATT
jgi:hypothetical protein